MAVILCIVLAFIFVLDSFVLQPKDSDPCSQKNLIDGEKNGLLTHCCKLVTSKVMGGQVWRVATSMFLHAGIPHILLNCIALWNMGCILERLIDGNMLLLLFLLSGVFSAVSMMALTKIEDGLGASTAIFGLIGVWLVLLLTNGNAVLEQMNLLNWAYLIFYAVAGNLIDPISRLEHLTGTIGGILFALLLL